MKKEVNTIYFKNFIQVTYGIPVFNLDHQNKILVRIFHITVKARTIGMCPG